MPYVPYSKFRVGAALITKNGEIFQEICQYRKMPLLD